MGLLPRLSEAGGYYDYLLDMRQLIVGFFDPDTPGPGCGPAGW